MAIPIDNGNEGGGTGSGGVSGGGGTESSSITGKNLREGGNISLRPKVLTSRHLYNLRNSGWAIPRPSWSSTDYTKDMISDFKTKANAFPSNADNPSAFIYADTENTAGSKTIQRFNAQDIVSNPPSNSPSPLGYFILDALDRGTSRLEQEAQLRAQYPTLTYAVDALPRDETPGGPKCIAEFAGRVFYAGFPGEIIDGDSSSPKMSSYVLFSQLVRDSTSIVACYQDADPTSKDQSDLVDTDGGFVRVEGAYNIVALVSIGSGLAVLANNGCWILQGGNDYGFSATNYKLTKVTKAGCISSGSVVVVENSVFYWSTDGIYNLTTNQYGDYVAENITKKTIQTFYNNIVASDKEACQGIYDSYEKKIKWLFGNRFADQTSPTELNLDMNIMAFYKFTIGNLLEGTKVPFPYTGIYTSPFVYTGSTNFVLVGTDSVQTTSLDDVYVDRTVFSESNRESEYLLIHSTASSIKYTFGFYKEPFHYDWKSANGIGVDAKSFLLTGALSGGDFQRKKNVVSLTVHFNKTEDGFQEDGSGDWELTNQSSCLTQVQWDWTNSANSGKWGRKFEAYRLRRLWIPSEISESFDNGYYVTETKSRIRGAGKVLSVLFESSPGKHMELLGWSVTMGSDGNV